VFIVALIYAICCVINWITLNIFNLFSFCANFYSIVFFLLFLNLTFVFETQEELYYIKKIYSDATILNIFLLISIKF
jgi:hypothetical protein